MQMLVEKLLPQARERLVTILDEAPLIEAAKLLRTGIDIVVVCVTPTTLVMTRSIVTCQPGDWLQNVWAVMKQRQLKNIPVIDSGIKPIGVLNAREVLNVLLGEAENEEALLRDYVMSVGYH
ncbi:CBS domain-containing protein [Hyphomicrobium sp.]|jgi:predicted transcriptional regulator|uniref:CBS domain-containing protein n=1 Tax=Hyphomicrobium sp. TaxID=82 RepID=UPI002D7E5E62|nr:CBS domain-containing protein [Hyphomicrobium sp.]